MKQKSLMNLGKAHTTNVGTEVDAEIVELVERELGHGQKQSFCLTEGFHDVRTAIRQSHWTNLDQMSAGKMELGLGVMSAGLNIQSLIGGALWPIGMHKSAERKLTD
jgi:hypothetical protein